MTASLGMFWTAVVSIHLAGMLGATGLHGPGSARLLQLCALTTQACASLPVAGCEYTLLAVLEYPCWQVAVVLTLLCCLLLSSSAPQIQTLDIPGEVKAGYSPIGFVRCGRAACKITKINWKVRILRCRRPWGYSALLGLHCACCWWQSGQHACGQLTLLCPDAQYQTALLASSCAAVTAVRHTCSAG